MGGRGSSSGISVKGKPYGTEYKSLLTSGNIKFVVKLDGSTTAPMETMTANRVYVTLSPQGDPKFISYYDRENKRKSKSIWTNHIKVSLHIHTTDTNTANTTVQKDFQVQHRRRKKWLHT